MSVSNRFAGHERRSGNCGCPVPHFDAPRSQWASSFHFDEQDKDCTAWRQLLALVDETAESGSKTFAPGLELGPKLWRDIVVLPPAIGQMTKVEDMNLYGSNLRSIPPEIGGMNSLRTFTPYTSYRLHWFPYEITRCETLVDSTVSTRALYGNYKFRPTFPQLPADLPEDATPSNCSVCDRRFENQPQQVWISLRVATDVLPLLAHACSDGCIAALPNAHLNYVAGPHQGGTDLAQPPTE